MRRGVGSKDNLGLVNSSSLSLASSNDLDFYVLLILSGGATPVLHTAYRELLPALHPQPIRSRRLSTREQIPNFTRIVKNFEQMENWFELWDFLAVLNFQFLFLISQWERSWESYIQFQITHYLVLTLRSNQVWIGYADDYLTPPESPSVTLLHLSIVKTKPLELNWIISQTFTDFYRT